MTDYLLSVHGHQCSAAEIQLKMEYTPACAHDVMVHAFLVGCIVSFSLTSNRPVVVMTTSWSLAVSITVSVLEYRVSQHMIVRDLALRTQGTLKPTQLHTQVKVQSNITLHHRLIRHI
jgi:hypothetical protein